MISDFLKGLVIGIGAIAPGVSGGALAVIMGVYEKITDALAHIFTNFWKKVVTFLPMVLGAVVGVLVFSRVINHLFGNYEVAVKYLFIGLMVGTFPSLRKQADLHGFRYRYLIPFLLALAVTVLFSVLEGNTTNAVSAVRPGFLHLVLYGAIIGFGTIIPGISASFILMYLGVYQIMLDGISGLEFAVLIPAGIGLILSILGFARLISLLFRKAYGYTYYAIFGFTIGSVVSIFPGFGLEWKYLLYLLLLAAGLTLTYQLSKFEQTDSVPADKRKGK